mgnify:CR=1 FL=1
MNKTSVKSLYFSTCELIKKWLNLLLIDANPTLNLAFEYNGKYWHSEKFRPSDHREKKSELCKNKGINLIHIEEEYWLKNKQEVKNKIKQLIIK